MKTRAVARDQLSRLASLATDLGYQVTYTNRTEVEGRQAGKTLTGISIEIWAED